VLARCEKKRNKRRHERKEETDTRKETNRRNKTGDMKRDKTEKVRVERD